MFLKSKLYQAQQFAKYYRRAKTRYNIQTPFVFNFIENILENDRNYYGFSIIEALRHSLLKENKSIELIDFGAGSQTTKTKFRRVNQIANSALSSDFQCRWLFNVVNEYKPKHILELGTSLGISTLYLNAASDNETKLFTLEGDPKIAHIARMNWQNAHHLLMQYTLANYDGVTDDLEKHIENDILKSAPEIRLIEGDFEKTLTTTLNLLKTVDLAFIDGNHRYDATMKYFHQILCYTNAHSILIFYDIYWSKDMTRAWNEIKNHASVTCSIDLFWCGIVFFNTDILKVQHVTLIRAKLKPFKFGWSF